MNQTLHAGSSDGMDNELQDHATVLPKQDRTKLPKTIDVEVRGYSGRIVIRNLTDGQQKAMAEKMDR